MSRQPLVTIGALNYNNERFVIEALESIKAQTYSNVELIIVDDCSTDNSPALIKAWLKDYGGPATLIEHEANLGITAACGSIYKHATGKYLSFLATDDAFLPHKTAEQVAILESHNGEYALAYGDIIEIDETGNTLTDNKYTIKGWRDQTFDPPSGHIFREILKGIFFYLHSSLIDLSLLRKTGFQFNKKVMADDWNIQLTLARHYKIIASPKVYAKYRRVQGSFSNEYLKEENIHNPYKSAIHLLLRYFGHPLNTEEDNAAIIEKVQGIYHLLGKSKGFRKKDAVKHNFTLFRKTRAPKHLYFSMRSGIAYMLSLSALGRKASS